MANVADLKGLIGTTEIRLAAWLEPNERYQRRYVPLDPEGLTSDDAGL